MGNCTLHRTVFRETRDVWVKVNCARGRANTLWFWGLLSWEHLLGDWRPPRPALLKRLPAHVVLRSYRKGEADSLLPLTHALRKQMFMNTGRKREKKQRVQGREEEDQLGLDQRMVIGVAVLTKENEAELIF